MSKYQVVNIAGNLKVTDGDNVISFDSEVGEIPETTSKQIIEAILEYYYDNNVHISASDGPEFKQVMTQLIRNVKYPVGFDKTKIPKSDSDNQIFDYKRIRHELYKMETGYDIIHHSDGSSTIEKF